jgi:hypothetical protein
VSVAVGACLPSCCSETGCITPFIKNPPSQQRAPFRDRYPATGIYFTIYNIHHCIILLLDVPEINRKHIRIVFTQMSPVKMNSNHITLKQVSYLLQAT